MVVKALTSIEICAGGGGQALGLEEAGFRHLALVENDPDACATLRTNRPSWHVVQEDLRNYRPSPILTIKEVDLLAGGVPCTPFTNAGQQLGTNDERDLLPEALRLVEVISPRAVLVENAADLLRKRKFTETRTRFTTRLKALGYQVTTGIVDAKDFGVPQRRERTVVIALRNDVRRRFPWPMTMELPPTVGEVLGPSMAGNGWKEAPAWAEEADDIAPTLVGGSRKHGGADLGPDWAKNQWAQLCVNGNAVAEQVPGPDFILRHGVGRGGRKGYPKLTTAQAALIQGFPDDWRFIGSKTARYRQVGNAFPPPVARALGANIAEVLLFDREGAAT